MADEPLPPSEPFDPNFHSAIRYRCPGLNQRNTFKSYAATIRCKTLVLTDPPPTSTFSNWSKICKVPSTYLPSQVMRRGRCEKTITYQRENIGQIRAEWACKHRGMQRATTNNFAKGKCDLRLLAVDHVEGTFAAVCHWNKKAVDNRGAKKACRRLNLTTDQLVLRISPNRWCNKLAPHLSNGVRACRHVWRNVRIYTTVINIGHCRETEIVDIGSYTFKRVCHRLYHTVNLPDLYGMDHPMQARLCREPEIWIQTYLGRSTCGLLKLQDPTPLKYEVKSIGLACKFTPTEFRPGQRYKCGKLTLGYAQNLIYGRVWGGREFYPLVNTSRSSGRFNGKFRTE